jgi:hypothetical protein
MNIPTKEIVEKLDGQTAQPNSIDRPGEPCDIKFCVLGRKYARSNNKENTSSQNAVESNEITAPNRNGQSHE